jgi:hypothetical protein
LVAVPGLAIAARSSRLRVGTPDGAGAQLYARSVLFQSGVNPFDLEANRSPSAHARTAKLTALQAASIM